MSVRARRALALGLALLVTAAAAALDARAAGEPQTFPEYWAAFRRAITAGDKAAVAGLTRFPLELRGADDAEPPVQVDREQFLADVFARILAQPELRPVGEDLDLVEKTQREWIESQAQVGAAEQTAPDAAAVYSLEFAREAGQWRLVRAYLDELPAPAPAPAQQ